MIKVHFIASTLIVTAVATLASTYVSHAQQSRPKAQVAAERLALEKYKKNVRRLARRARADFCEAAPVPAGSTCYPGGVATCCCFGWWGDDWGEECFLVNR